MKKKTTVGLATFGLLAVFVLIVIFAVVREVRREEALRKQSISGLVELDLKLLRSGLADVVRTDRLVLLLVDPDSRRPVAMTFVSPLVPPQTIRIGVENVREGTELQGPYLLVGITDKDGEIYRVTPGEVYGRSLEPLALGTTEYRLVLNEPFRGSLFNKPTPRASASGSGDPRGGDPSGDDPSGDDPRFAISGTIVVSRALQDRVDYSDRLVVLLFDPDTPRPLAFQIIPSTLLPQKFTITLPPEARGNLKPGYHLRILTDKNNDPFGSVEGEVVGRSTETIPLGTTGLVFELNQPYVR